VFAYCEKKSVLILLLLYTCPHTLKRTLSPRIGLHTYTHAHSRIHRCVSSCCTCVLILRLLYICPHTSNVLFSHIGLHTYRHSYHTQILCPHTAAAIDCCCYIYVCPHSAAAIYVSSYCCCYICVLTYSNVLSSDIGLHTFTNTHTQIWAGKRFAYQKS